MATFGSRAAPRVVHHVRRLRRLASGEWIRAVSVRSQEELEALDVPSRGAVASIHVAAADELRARSHADLVAFAVVADDRTDVIDLLSRQLSSPVLWLKSMLTLAEIHQGPIVEVGPGKVLTGLMRRIAPDATVHSLSDVQALESVASAAG